MRERCQNINFAVVLSNAGQPGLLEPELLFDHTKWVLSLGPYVCLGRLY